MKNECNIVRDILPLYFENMVSPDTAEFVSEHLKTCTECQKEYERIKEPEIIESEMEVLPLMSIKRKMRSKKIQIVAFTAILVIALLVSAFAFISAPEYFSYSENLMSITENKDKSITITFNEKVTDYSCEFYLDPYAEIEPIESGRYYYNIEAWSSLWDRWFSNRGVQSTTIYPRENLPFTVYYISNSNEVDVCVYGQPLTVNGDVISLPRLSLGYYLLFALICLGGLVIMRFAFKKKDNIKLWIERIMMYPISYMLGHLVVRGISSTTYSLQRDFTLIVFLSVIIYCGLLLAHNIYRISKENKQNKNAKI